ncbi:putative enoyl-CoA hydratase/carnithine racemase [Burkholderia pseudomallei]|nr:putative enoyl-CoA hydratase/carnithine racemase [Burkholderia pseudomallei]
MEANAESNHGVTRIESGRDREWDGGRRGPAGRTPDVTNATNLLLTVHRSLSVARYSCTRRSSPVGRRRGDGARRSTCAAAIAAAMRRGAVPAARTSSAY